MTPLFRRSTVRVLSLLAGALFGVFGLPIAHAMEPIDVIFTPRPPYYTLSNTGEIGGVVAGPAQEVFSAAGIETRWTMVSFNRQLQMVEESLEPLCAIGWFKTAEREAFAKFTDPVYQDKAMVVVARADNIAMSQYRRLANLMSDTALTLGSKLGFSYGSDVDALIDDLAPSQVMTDQSPLGMMRMLIGRRFDYMVSAPEEAVHLMAEIGEGAKVVLTMLPMEDLTPRNKRYILCSMATSDTLIDALNTEIAARRP